MADAVTSGLREALDAALESSSSNNNNNISSHSPSPSAADTADTASVDDMGYEDHQPTTQQQQQRRRGSMSHMEEKERRASIKAIMADDHLTPFEKRKSIQHLMDGRRNSISASSHCSSYHSVSGSEDDDNDHNNKNDHHNHHDNGDADDRSNEDFEASLARSDRKFAICNDQTRRAEHERPPCPHYDRKCTIIAPCCGAAFGCRICHDDCPVLPPILVKRTPARRSNSMPNMMHNDNNPQYDTEDETHHAIDRFAIREVICRQCYTRQSSKTNQCIECSIRFGEYHCSLCNLWMSDKDSPYHCSECGFCRVGGAENFQHCDACGMCIDKSLYDEHNCKDGKYKANCPVCQEFLFSSRSASHEMPCGHAIHWDCFRQLAAHDSRCPVCKKTAETRERMQPTWDAMAAGIVMQPVPAELCRVVDITCNDCEKNHHNRAWHFLGVQCWHCQSFNTVVDKLVCAGMEASEFLKIHGDGKEAINNEEHEAAQLGSSPQTRRVGRRRSALM